MKVCITCHKKRHLEKFSFRNRLTGKRHSVCKDCHTKYRRKHYLLHYTKYLTKAKRWDKLQREKMTRFIIEYLKQHPCVDCGETDIVVLDFDHLRDKKFNICQSLTNGMESVKKEIEKCEVRCSNCHRRKTAKMRGTRKYLYTLGVVVAQ